MYGMVNNALQDMLTARLGEQAWRQILLKAGVDEEIFISTHAYPDDITYRLVSAAAEVLGLPQGWILCQFGRWWVLQTARKKYGGLMKLGSRSLKEFLRHLPNFHTRIMMVFPKLQPPEFEVLNEGENEVRLCYQSHRPGLTLFVRGLLEGLAEMFDVDADIVLEQSVEDGAACDIFLVRWSVREAS